MPPRIATLLPSATEIVCALGLADQIVGISHECDFPARIRDRPVLTRAVIDPSGRSAEIDRQVRDVVSDGLSVYTVIEDALRRAAPDIIFTQDQCAVCAVSLDQVRESARRTLGTAVEVLSLSPNTIDDVLGDFTRVAAVTDREREGRHLIDSSRQRLDTVSSSAARSRSNPRVACIEWIEPPMVAGNWIPELVHLCAGIYGQTAPGEHSRTTTWQELTEYAPDVLLIMPCGFDLGQTRRELPTLFDNPLWSGIPAVRNRRVYSIDGNAYMNRPGPRIIDSAEIVAGLVQPDLFASLIPSGSYERV